MPEHLSLVSSPEQPPQDPRHQAIQERVVARFSAPALETYAYKTGKYAMQLVQMVDYLVRYGAHTDFCDAATAGERCVCGLSETLAEAKAAQAVASSEAGCGRER